MLRWWQHPPAETPLKGNTFMRRAPGGRVMKPLQACSRMLCRYQDGLAKKELDDAADRFERRSRGNGSQSTSICICPQAGVSRS